MYVLLLPVFTVDPCWLFVFSVPALQNRKVTANVMKWRKREGNHRATILGSNGEVILCILARNIFGLATDPFLPLLISEWRVECFAFQMSQCKILPIYRQQ